MSLLTGCAGSPDRTDVATVFFCGLAGVGVSVATGSEAFGAAAATLCAGVVWAVHYQSKQTRSAAEDRRRHGQVVSTGGSGPAIHIRQGVSSPSQAKPGDKVTIATDYSLMVPADAPAVEVTESWVITKDGKTFQSLEPHREQRAAGGWYAEAEITLPRDLPLGTYTVEHKVSAGGSMEAITSTLVVG